MAKQEVSEIFKNPDKYLEALRPLIHAILGMGGQIEDFLNLNKHPHRVRAAAAAILDRPLPKMKFSFHPFIREGDGDSIRGHEVIRRAAEMPGIPCDEKYARMLMAYPTLVPEKDRGKSLIIEGWRHPQNPAYCAVLCWFHGRPIDFWFYLGDDWSEHGRVVRLSD